MTETFTEALTAASGTGEPIIIDGGLGTALEDRGIDLSHELWSASLLRDAPDTLAEAHAEFIRSGARIVTTASYQATPLGFARAGVSAEEGRRLIEDSVALARQAASAAAGILVAGSVGPYGAALGNGAEYTGDYELSQSEFADFHRPRIAALVAGGADLLAIETQPKLSEIRALARLADEYRIPAWLSVTLADADRLPDDSTLGQLAEVACASAMVAAVGLNCVRPSLVTPALTALAAHTDLPLIAYPNSGERYDAEAMAWRASTAEAGPPAWPVAAWGAAGARLIGGCCRTGPADIAELSRASSRG